MKILGLVLSAAFIAAQELPCTPPHEVNALAGRSYSLAKRNKRSAESESVDYEADTVIDTDYFSCGCDCSGSTSISCECDCPREVIYVNAAIGPRGRQGNQGVQGGPGYQGSTGTHGWPGLVGPRGVSGAPGNPGKSAPQGNAGKEGSKGRPGPQGKPGEQGPKGDMGLAGHPGEPGEPGIQGHVGQQGLTGPDGLQGANGEVGPRGPPGDQGPAGAPGQPGVAGIQGVTGPQGLRGLQGQPGEPGEPGIQGLRGSPGNRGETGEDGIRGEKGQTGNKGSAGFSLPGPPGIQGEPGDDITFDADALERYFLELLHEEIARLQLVIPARREACECGEIVTTTTTTTTTTQAPTTTTVPLPEQDLVFLVDASKSITRQEWNNVKSFLSKVTSSLEAVQDTRVSTLIIIQYDDDADTAVARTAVAQADDIRRKINAMVQTYAGTDIYGGFNYLLDPRKDEETGFVRDNDATKYLFTITETCPTRKSHRNRNSTYVSDAREIFDKQQVLAIGPEAAGCDIDFEDFISAELTPIPVPNHETLANNKFVKRFVDDELSI